MISHTSSAGVGVEVGQQALDLRDQVAIDERLPRKVEVDADPARGQLHRLGRHPAVDLADQVEALGDREERVRADHGLVAIDHPQQQLVSRGPTAGQRDDRLGVEHEAVLVERLLDPSHPTQRLELAPAAFVLDLAQGDVGEDDDEPLAIACHDRRGRIGDREQLAVLAREHVVVDADSRGLPREPSSAGSPPPGTGSRPHAGSASPRAPSGSAQLFLGPAEQLLGGAIDVASDGPRPSEREHALRHTVGDR